jgi:hypothetical protein
MLSRCWLGTAFAAAFLLSACAGGEAERPVPKGLMSVTARLVAPPAKAVDVVVANVPPGRRIEQLTLIDAQGGHNTAPSLVPVSVAEGGATTRPFIGIGISGGSSSRIRPSLSLGGNITRSGSDRISLRIEARVPIPDAAAYRATSKSWRVEVVFTEINGETRTLAFPVGGP